MSQASTVLKRLKRALRRATGLLPATRRSAAHLHRRLGKNQKKVDALRRDLARAEQSNQETARVLAETRSELKDARTRLRETERRTTEAVRMGREAARAIERLSARDVEHRQAIDGLTGDGR